MNAVTNPALRSWVLLHVGNSRFALPAESVMELAPPVRLHHFPHSSQRIAGVIVRRGRIIPVYDVAPILCGRESSVHRFYLIAQRAFGTASEASAIPVNGECELATAELHPLSADGPGYFSGKLSIGDENINVLDLGALVTASEEFATNPTNAEVQR
jgi:chemotaxis signal transduction protein